MHQGGADRAQGRGRERGPPIPSLCPASPPPGSPSRPAPSPGQRPSGPEHISGLGNEGGTNHETGPSVTFRAALGRNRLQYFRPPEPPEADSHRTRQDPEASPSAQGPGGRGQVDPGGDRDSEVRGQGRWWETEAGVTGWDSGQSETGSAELRGQQATRQPLPLCVPKP